jgi:hypothetical protein
MFLFKFDITLSFSLQLKQEVMLEFIDVAEVI